MNNLLDSKSDQVRYNAAKDILDRTGYKPPDKQEITLDTDLNNPFKELTKEQLIKLAGVEDG